MPIGTKIIEGMWGQQGIFLCGNYDDWIRERPTDEAKLYFDGTYVFYRNADGQMLGYVRSAIPKGQIGALPPL